MDFLALDLETTGLDPKHARIVEIAVVRFHFEVNNQVIQSVIDDERHMLLDPECDLSPEFSLITGITPVMLRGKKTWSEVCQSIARYMQDSSHATLVGHNVLFDYNILKQHGISVCGKGGGEIPILDTFELAECFSQEAESLNLGFLTDKYGLSKTGEHRALSDTKMSMRLLEYYLNKYRGENEHTQKLTAFIAQKTREGTIPLFLELLASLSCSLKHTASDTEVYEWIESYALSQHKSKQSIMQKKKKNVSSDIRFLSPQDEFAFLKEYSKQKSPLSLVIPGYEQLESIWKARKEIWDENTHIAIFHSHSSSISPKKLCAFVRSLKHHALNQKMSILLLRILLWLRCTETGRVQELRYYNDEISQVSLWQREDGEDTIFTEREEKTRENADILLLEMRDWLKEGSCVSNHTSLLIREPLEVETGMRRVLTNIVDFGELYKCINSLSDGEMEEVKEVEGILRFFEAIVESVPKRPSGIEPIAPGQYGETYHITHEALWQKGGIWIDRIRSRLASFLQARNAALPDTLRINLETCIRITTLHDRNTSLIVTMHERGTKLFSIPRDVREKIYNALSGYESVMSYDFGGYGKILEKFIHDHVFPIGGIGDFGDTARGKTFIPGARSIPETLAHILADSTEPGPHSVILTTNKKHIVEIAELITRLLPSGICILAQGISGGKQKILTNYRKNTHGTILIGLYDTWIDSAIWEMTDHVILAKVPFDPPNDLFFLARTIGMENNFLEYSLPIAIMKLRRLRTRTFPKSIICLDIRLWKSDWGKQIIKELI